MANKLLFLWQVGAYLSIVAIGVGGLVRLHSAQVHNCREIEKVKAPLRSAIISADESSLPMIAAVAAPGFCAV